MGVARMTGDSDCNRDDWPSNYFNYFTEVEEHFRKVRASGLFLLSPLDWALIESWKDAGVPLDAVLRGIDAAFAKWRSRKSRIQQVNSLAYCSQAVLREAQAMAGGPKPVGAGEPVEAPFTLDEVRGYLAKNAAKLRGLHSEEFDEIAASLEQMAASAEECCANLEELEQRLSALDEKAIALLRSRLSEDELIEARKELDQHLRPYRSKMSAPQLAMLEKQYLERRLLEASGVPRLSLFYLS